MPSKPETAIERETVDQAAALYGITTGNASSFQHLKISRDLAKLSVAELRQEATIARLAKALQAQHPELSDDEARLWAEQWEDYSYLPTTGEMINLEQSKAIAAGRKPQAQPKMSPELQNIVEISRQRANRALEVEKVRTDYHNSLLDNDGIKAAFLYADALSLGIDVSDIETAAAEKTSLNLEQIHQDEILIPGLS